MSTTEEEVMSITKQSVLEQERALTVAALDEAEKAARGNVNQWEGCLEQALKKQRTLRAALHASCEASSGHVYLYFGDDVCGICGYEHRTPGQVAAINLTKAK